MPIILDPNKIESDENEENTQGYTYSPPKTSVIPKENKKHFDIRRYLLIIIIVAIAVVMFFLYKFKILDLSKLITSIPIKLPLYLFK